MATEQEVDKLKYAISPWECLVQIQCTKSLDVVNRTAGLLAEAGCNKEEKYLKGQLVYSVCLLFTRCYICVSVYCN